MFYYTFKESKLVSEAIHLAIQCYVECNDVTSIKEFYQDHVTKITIPPSMKQSRAKAIIDFSFAVQFNHLHQPLGQHLKPVILGPRFTFYPGAFIHADTLELNNKRCETCPSEASIPTLSLRTEFERRSKNSKKPFDQDEYHRAFSYLNKKSDSLAKCIQKKFEQLNDAMMPSPDWYRAAWLVGLMNAQIEGIEDDRYNILSTRHGLRGESLRAAQDGAAFFVNRLNLNHRALLKVRNYVVLNHMYPSDYPVNLMDEKDKLCFDAESEINAKYCQLDIQALGKYWGSVYGYMIGTGLYPNSKLEDQLSDVHVPAKLKDMDCCQIEAYHYYRHEGFQTHFKQSCIQWLQTAMNETTKASKLGRINGRRDATQSGAILPIVDKKDFSYHERRYRHHPIALNTYKNAYINSYDEVAEVNKKALSVKAPALLLTLWDQKTKRADNAVSSARSLKRHR